MLDRDVASINQDTNTLAQVSYEVTETYYRDLNIFKFWFTILCKYKGKALVEFDKIQQSILALMIRHLHQKTVKMITLIIYNYVELSS